MRRDVVLLAVLLSWPAAPLAGQEPDCQRRTVPVSVIDREGNQVWGLTPGDFRGEFRGQPVTILSATLDTGPRRVVIVLDASGGMRTGGKSTLAHRAAVSFARGAPGNLSLALLVFADDITREVPFRQGRQGVVVGLVGLTKEKGQTALWDALARAANLLQPAQPGDAIYVISDGRENASRESSGGVERLLLRGGVRLYVFLLADPLGPGLPRLDELYGPDWLASLSEVTGGNLMAENAAASFSGYAPKWYHITAGNESELGVGQERLSRQMARPYLLGVELPVELDKQRKWKLEVVDKRGKTRKELAVLYPRKLVPCQAEGEKEKLENRK